MELPELKSLSGHRTRKGIPYSTLQLACLALTNKKMVIKSGSRSLRMTRRGKILTREKIAIPLVMDPVHS